MRAATKMDIRHIRALLVDAGLPIDDLDTASGLQFSVVEDRGELAGAIGLERHGTVGLLRSLVVAPTHRKYGLGRLLVAGVERQASEAGVALLVLLTQTAEAYFTGLGYIVIERVHAPNEIKDTAQFRSLCPSSAICMTKILRTDSTGVSRG
jgi:amino-acid N-acetyltransferase